MRLAASMPSLVWVGGIRMSVSTTSGEVSATARINETGSLGHRDHLDLVDLGQERGKAFTDQEVVVGDDEAERHSCDSTHGPTRAGSC